MRAIATDAATAQLSRAHSQPAQRRADARRDRDLQRMGYRVVHLSAHAVQHRLADAVAHLVVEIDAAR